MDREPRVAMQKEVPQPNHGFLLYLTQKLDSVLCGVSVVTNAAR